MNETEKTILTALMEGRGALEALKDVFGNVIYVADACKAKKGGEAELDGDDARGPRVFLDKEAAFAFARSSVKEEGDGYRFYAISALLVADLAYSMFEPHPVFNPIE